MKPRSYSSLLLAAALAVLPAIGRAAEDNTSSIKFSDPAKAGTLRIVLGRGDLRVQGDDTAEITVKSDVPPASNRRTKDGLRVISASSGFALTEKDNVVTLDGAGEWGKGSSNFRVTVPRNTSVIVQNTWGGDVTCTAVAGDLEINSMRGEIKLEDVSGSVIVGTMSGQINASIRELREGKPLSFTSMNGEVVLRLPESAKANVRLRTQNGSVLTDFDENILVTKAESSGPGFGKHQFVYKGSGGKVITAEVEEAIREATRVSATAVKQALEAVKEGLAESRLDAEEARKQLEEANREMERARREADRQRRDSERERRSATAPAAPAAPATPVAPSAAHAPKPPTMPKIPIPTMGGGKLVTGTLNGGGPEISVSTMNGDVTLRKLDAK